MKIERTIVLTKGLEEEGMGSFCSMDVEFQFCKMKMF